MTTKTPHLSDSKNRTLVITRHAHRDKPQGPEIDNGLSDKGQRQAKHLAEFFLRRFPGLQAVLLSSPKLRCRETLLPLSAALRTEIQVVPNLDEGGDLETKIAAFMSGWKNSRAPLTVLCSHGDWIPECIALLIGAPIEMEKGAWAEFEMGSDGRMVLVSLVQKPR